MYKKYKPVWKQVESFASSGQQEYSSSQKLAEIIHLDSGEKVELAHLDCAWGATLPTILKKSKRKMRLFSVTASLSLPAQLCQLCQ